MKNTRGQSSRQVGMNVRTAAGTGTLRPQDAIVLAGRTEPARSHKLFQIVCAARKIRTLKKTRVDAIFRRPHVPACGNPRFA